MKLSPDQRDAVAELINMGVGRASASLNELLECAVELSVPSVLVVSPDEVSSCLGAEAEELLSTVQMAFRGGFSGKAELVFPPESAQHLVSAAVGEPMEADQDDAVWVGTMTEVGNILLNGVMGTISNLLTSPLDYSVPSYVEASLEELVKCESAGEPQSVLIARTRFSVAELSIEGDVVLVFETESFAAVLESLDSISTSLD